MADDAVSCFVCTEAATERAPLYRVCSCKTFVHEACFRTLLARVPSHRARCAVCLQPYAGVVLRPCVRRHCTCEPVLVFAYVVMAAMWTTFVLLHRYVHARRSLSLELSLVFVYCIFAIGCTFSLVCLHRQFVLQHERLCCVTCCAVQRRAVVTMANFATPETSACQSV